MNFMLKELWSQRFYYEVIGRASYASVFFHEVMTREHKLADITRDFDDGLEVVVVLDVRWKWFSQRLPSFHVRLPQLQPPPLISSGWKDLEDSTSV
uniref:Uncharacterized protein n=1 Tax=Lactuca sativa TaxID=4236 RepID=A0A9R1VRW1_LACSA|nr:hypothetical protein LSAT_V11C400186350 [Lactuca sativa]